MLRVGLLLLLSMLPPAAQGSTVNAVLPGAELRGQATFRVLGRALYEARLYTPDGAPLDWQNDMALELSYLRRLTRADLVTSTLRELERTGGALPLQDALAQCYADVGKGDRYLAVSNGPDELWFWRNDRRMCVLSYPGITQRFMAIFLGDNTRSRAFTHKLLGK